MTGVESGRLRKALRRLNPPPRPAPAGRRHDHCCPYAGIPAGGRAVTVDHMPIDRAKTFRGAFAGAVAAGVWAAQMPLDKRVFGSDFDDVELLGKVFTRGPAWPLVGWALHLQNGALFGAAYANLAPHMPIPSWARGPLAATAENFGTWPLTAITHRVHPARRELPAAFSSARALAQSSWRHLLFGVLLGELERRLNVSEPIELPDYSRFASSNGHGRLERVVPAG